MYIKKNIFNNKNKYLIISGIIFILSFVTLIGFTINTSAQKVLSETREKYGSYVSIQPDIESINPGTRPPELNLTKEQYQEFSQSTLVKSTSFIASDSFNSENLEAIKSEVTSEIPSREGAPEMISGDFTLYAIDNIENGQKTFPTKSITSGEIPTDINEVLISETLAKENDLSIGDDFKIKSVSDSEYNLTLQITGLYTDSDTSYLNDPRQETFTNPNNSLLTNLTTLEIPTTNLNYQVTFKLKNYLDVEKFQTELYQKGLGSEFIVDSGEATYNTVVTPLESMINVTKFFMIIILLIGVSILIFISILALQDRKYEFGVLRAMGMKKNKLIKMIVSEVLVISSIAILFATILGIALSIPIGNYVYDQISSTEQISNTPDRQPGKKSRPGQTPITTSIESLEAIPINISLDAVFQEIVLMLIIITSSTIITIRYILKLDTAKLLKERE